MATVSIQRPAPTEHNPYYSQYVELVPTGDLVKQLQKQTRATSKLLRGVSPKKSQYRYAAGKWSVREVIGHLVDTERVFAYRAVTFARADATPLPSFDENAWGSSSNAHERPLKDLLAEFEAVRASTVALLKGMNGTQLARTGTASNHPITVRALAYIIAGHELHHVKILRERYGL